MLRIELAALQEEDFDLNLVGFDTHELDELLLGEAVEDGEDIVLEPPVKPVTISGDVWLCGPHRLLSGDATSPEAVAALLGEQKPALMVTDPPYGIELDSELRDRAGLNGCGEASHMKKRTADHTETTISGDTRADWSEAFELVPSLEVG